METLRLVVEFTYDDVVMHDDDEEDIDWFYSDILFHEDFAVISSEIGDEIGKMRILELLDTESEE